MKNKFINLTLIKNSLVAAILCSLLQSLAFAAVETPSKVLKRTNDRLKVLLQKKTPEGSPEESSIKKQISGEVNSFLDFPELAKISLAKNWAERSKAEQDEFTRVLKQLIENNYIKQLRTNLNYRIEYGKEKIEGEEAVVPTTVRFKNTKGKEEKVGIDYKLHLTNGRWIAVDVITDEVSLVRNYQSQFNRIIKKEGFTALLKKMRDKVQDGDKATPVEPTATPAANPNTETTKSSSANKKTSAKSSSTSASR